MIPTAFVVLHLTDNRIVRGEVDLSQLDAGPWVDVVEETGRTVHVNIHRILFWHRAVPG